MTQTSTDRRLTCRECGAHGSWTHPLLLAVQGWLCARCWSALCADD